MKLNYIDHQDTGFFSRLIDDYLKADDGLKAFYRFLPTEQGVDEAVREREKFPVNREVLVEVLREQYQGLQKSALVEENIEKLRNSDTFTVCTAHQPNLMTGYLYFVYKILHAVKLAGFLDSKFPDKNFVPVYYMGSEDNDLEELGFFRYGDEGYRWDTEQRGAVGRMGTKDLKPLLEALKKKLGPPGASTERLKKNIDAAYLGCSTIAEATRFLVNALLGQYGIVVLDADDARLKKVFVPVIKEELFEPKSGHLVAESSKRLNEKYTAQAYSRPINFFYLKDNMRERIEFYEGKWQVLNTDICWTERVSLEKEIERHPERFSPNVILRGLYQECILPNVAFIGGGSELAYWMQLKEVFSYYRVFFPVLILRQSVLWMGQPEVAAQEKCGLSDEEMFLPLPDLLREVTLANTEHSLTLDSERRLIQGVLEDIQSKAVEVDQTLGDSAGAALAKIKHQLAVLEKKMLRAEKKNLCVTLDRVKRFIETCFPQHKLQERYETFLRFYTIHGDAFFDTLLKGTLPFGNKFLIVKEDGDR